MPNLYLSKQEEEMLDKVDWDKTIEKHADRFHAWRLGEKGWSRVDLESMFVIDYLTDDEIVWLK